MKRTAWLGGSCLCLLVLIWAIASGDDDAPAAAPPEESAPADTRFEHANWNLADQAKAKAKRPARSTRLEGVEIAVAREPR